MARPVSSLHATLSASDNGMSAGRDAWRHATHTTMNEDPKPARRKSNAKVLWIIALGLVVFFAMTWQIWFVLFALLYISIASLLGHGL